MRVESTPVESRASTTNANSACCVLRGFVAGRMCGVESDLCANATTSTNATNATAVASTTNANAFWCCDREGSICGCGVVERNASRWCGIVGSSSTNATNGESTTNANVIWCCGENGSGFVVSVCGVVVCVCA